MIAHNGSYGEDHASEIIFTRKILREDANPDSPATTYPVNYIHEVCTSSRTVFTQEHNELSVQQVVQYSQEKEGEYLHYHILGLNES